MSLFAKATILTATVLSSTLALAQDYTLSPRFGGTTLSGGFTPDPQVVSVRAGGDYPAGNVNSSCNGNVTEEPTYQLTFTPGSLGLGIYVNAAFDTTILINAPDAQWYCNDDHDDLENLNSGVYFDDPDSGRYDIWVGAYSTDNNNREALLAISEYSSSSWRTDLAPSVPTLTLTSGFTPDPYTLDVMAGGPNQGSNLNASCNGYVSASPTYRVNYTSGSLGLTFYTNAEFDTTLAIQAPNGSWYCNDDHSALENLNSGYYFSSPASGNYNVYVGAYSESNSNRSAQLLISEFDLVIDEPEPAPVTPDGEIQFGSKLL